MKKIMKQVLTFIYSLVMTITLSACEKYDLWDEAVDGETYNQIDINSVQKRAQQIARIKWKPLGAIPNNNGSYAAGKMVTGMPYSSVKELDKFIGYDVSFHTFMTAVNNPRSVLYTENVGKAPYHGINCASYYGTVCNVTVCYALGIDFPWDTNQIDKCGCFKRTTNQDPQSIRIADVIWQSGHELMIYDMQRDSKDSLVSVTILESNSGGTAIKEYSYESFIERWIKNKWKLYRFVKGGESRPYESLPFYQTRAEYYDSYEYNAVLCPSRGDKSVYRMGENVVINILDDSYTNLIVSKNGNEELFMQIGTPDIVLTDLGIGKYSIVATNENGEYSAPVYFEIVQTQVSSINLGNQVEVSYSSENGTPKYVVLCKLNGSKLVTHKLTTSEQNSGKVLIKSPNNESEFYTKVYFETEWGRVTNEPIKNIN